MQKLTTIFICSLFLIPMASSAFAIEYCLDFLEAGNIGYSSSGFIMYEDAEDESVNKWNVYDNVPAGAQITNVYDGFRQSNVIELTGEGTNNGYRLRKADGSRWYNTEQTVIEWSMKYDEYFVIYIDMETTAGHRYLQYNPVNTNQLGTGEYVLFGLGTGARNGQWHTFVRDLQADLTEAQPGAIIEEVNGFLVRGSGMVDDIKMLNEMPDSTMYEDATDGSTSRWMVYDSDPAGAQIFNTYDTDRMSRVIEFSGSGTNNGYRLRAADGRGWLNTTQTVIEWSMKYGENFIVYIDLETNDGHKYLQYQPVNVSVLGAGEYVKYGLGTGAVDGRWQTFVRDLQADMEAAQPGVIIEEVNGFLIRGSGRVDDIKMLDAIPENITCDAVNPESVRPGDTFSVDIWASDVPESILGSGFLLVYNPSQVNIISVQAYDGVDVPGPWDGSATFKIPDAAGSGSYMVALLQLSCAVPDSARNVILARVTFQCASSGSSSIIVSPVPGFATTVGCRSGFNYDPHMGTSILTITQDEIACSDGVDNDLDDLTDCYDPDCSVDCGGTMYEDAEDESVGRWIVYDNVPVDAQITIVSDDVQGNVIEFSGAGTNNGYRLRKSDGSRWYNTEQTVIEWSMKYGEYFVVYIDLETDVGHRYLQYTPVNLLNPLDLGEYVLYGLGTDARNGQWQTFTRDLQADLEAAQSNVVIEEVNGFLIRGDGMVDDIKMLNEMPESIP